MSLSLQPEGVQEADALPVRPVVARIRRLIVLAMFAALGYSAFTVASKGYCPGGVNADGTFIDAAGNVTELSPSCINLTLQPSVFIYIGIFAIVIGALTFVLRRASDVPAALRYLNRGALTVVVLAVASVAISQIWFAMIPITDWNGAGTFFYPFPFGSVDLTITPMQTQ
ncbi:hypothetical protein [Cryobacterium luteum]|uniref:Uncharacterized protein n=1 Tax=Cryobacterium luteum TaxID=1424661 RepID=A0A1H8IJ70_9MICO|nr:hypothetical protein [Cryobacterium luteum]TFB95482.1 hypothetical protein E3O10_00025 [Cryobacterium luteum]SEN68920.1 hypothetical protein SAMN05216281_111123 [Cryobacterium luteum]